MKYILYLIFTIAIFNLSLSQCYGYESFIDLDNNGFWTANETLTNDCNSNGIWDADTCEVDCEAEFKINNIINNGDGTYSIDLFFRSTEDIYGYQFDFISSTSGYGDTDNVLTATPGSDLTGANLILSGNGGTIISVSFTGASIPATPEWSDLTILTATEVDPNGGDIGSSVILNAHNEGTTTGTTFLVAGAGGVSLLAEWYDSVWTVGSESFSLDNDAVSPYLYSLKDNYPNPFNPSTTIEYSVAEMSDVNISVYDASGRLVKNLVSSQHVPENYQVSWNGTNESGTSVAAGMYFYKINAGSFVETKKMLLIK